MHKTMPWFSAQFHPEAKCGPSDTSYLFDQFIEAMGDPEMPISERLSPVVTKREGFPLGNVVLPPPSRRGPLLISDKMARPEPERSGMEDPDQWIRDRLPGWARWEENIIEEDGQEQFSEPLFVTDRHRIIVADETALKIAPHAKGTGEISIVNFKRSRQAGKVGRSDAGSATARAS